MFITHFKAAHLPFRNKITDSREGDQDGRVGGHKFAYTYKHIKNTSTCGAILTENKLETDSLVKPSL